MSDPTQEVPKFSVDFVYDEEAAEEMPHWYMNGQDMGVMDWEMTEDGKHGYIDYLDHENFIKEHHLGRIAIPALAEDLHTIYPKLETVDFPRRQEVFKQVA